MKNAFIQSLLGSLVVVLVALGCVLGIDLYTTAVPEQVERDTINISQADYEQARARWDAQKISVYELLLCRRCCCCILFPTREQQK